MATPAAPPRDDALDPALRARVDALIAEGWEIFERFDLEVRQRDFHPFVAADYERVLATLLAVRRPGGRFLEWGSASGVITIMADMLGFEAYGIELDGDLVATARALAERHGSAARFAAGSFIPSGYRYRPPGGDGRPGTIGTGLSGYVELQHPLDDFDVVYGYPWDGEDAMMLDLMRQYGSRDALLLVAGGEPGMRAFRAGKPVPIPDVSPGRS